MRWLILSVILLADCVLGQSANKVASLKFKNDKEQVRCIVRFSRTPTSSGVGLVAGRGGTVLRKHHLVPIVIANLSKPAALSVATNPYVVDIVPDKKGRMVADTVQWNVKNVAADIVWPFGYKGDGIKVGVVDTGIDYRHPDISPNYVGGIDIADNDSDPLDWHGHGTHCAGIIAADDNGTGIVGVAPNAKLYAVKVFANGSTWCWWSDVIAGIEWCVSHGINVISMSIGGDYDPVFEQACNSAYQAGCLLVAAAGNSGGAVEAPAMFSSVVAVGALDKNNARPSWSCYGPELEFVAPGVSIYSTVLNASYGYKSGTSMACPHVSGLAALIWAKYRNETSSQIRQRMITGTVDLGATGHDNYYGYGLPKANLVIGTQPTLTQISCVPSSLKLAIGESAKLKVVATYSDNTTVDVTTETIWEVNPVDIARVDNGNVTGLTVGKGTITAGYKNLTANVSIEVYDMPVLAGLEIMPAEVRVVFGKTQTIAAVARLSNGNMVNVTDQAVWSVSPAGIVKFVAVGLLEGIGVGVCNVKAEYEGYTAYADVTVTPTQPATSINIWRCEYVKARNQLRVFAYCRPADLIYKVYNRDGSYCYGKMAYAGGDIFVLSLVYVRDPNGVVIVRAADGTEAKANVTYR